MGASRRERNRSGNGVKEIRMPILDAEAQTCLLTKWLVKVGDIVEIDQDLAIMDNGEEGMELPSPLDGVILKLYCEPGEAVSSGDVLALVEEN